MENDSPITSFNINFINFPSENIISIPENTYDSNNMYSITADNLVDISILESLENVQKISNINILNCKIQLEKTFIPYYKDLYIKFINDIINPTNELCEKLIYIQPGKCHYIKFQKISEYSYNNYFHHRDILFINLFNNKFYKSIAKYCIGKNELNTHFEDNFVDIVTENNFYNFVKYQRPTFRLETNNYIDFIVKMLNIFVKEELIPNLDFYRSTIRDFNYISLDKKKRPFLYLFVDDNSLLNFNDYRNSNSNMKIKTFIYKCFKYYCNNKINYLTDYISSETINTLYLNYTFYKHMYDLHKFILMYHCIYDNYYFLYNKYLQNMKQYIFIYDQDFTQETDLCSKYINSFKTKFYCLNNDIVTYNNYIFTSSNPCDDDYFLYKKDKIKKNLLMYKILREIIKEDRIKSFISDRKDELYRHLYYKLYKIIVGEYNLNDTMIDYLFDIGYNNCDFIYDQFIKYKNYIVKHEGLINEYKIFKSNKKKLYNKLNKKALELRNKYNDFSDINKAVCSIKIPKYVKYYKFIRTLLSKPIIYNLNIAHVKEDIMCTSARDITP